MSFGDFSHTSVNVFISLAHNELWDVPHVPVFPRAHFRAK